MLTQQHSIYQTVQYFIRSKTCVLYVTIFKHSLHSFSVTTKFIDQRNWPANNQYLSLVDFSLWGALQQKLYRLKFRDVDYLKCVLLNCWDQISQDTVSAATDQLLKILTMVIMAQDGYAECCLNRNVYHISVNCEFKMIRMQKMNVIDKISCYFSAVLLH